MRATTFTPRSCPSSPTLATSTREAVTRDPRGSRTGGRNRRFSYICAASSGGGRSQAGGLGVAAEDVGQRVDDLAQRGVALDRLDERGHEVHVGRRLALQLGQRRIDGGLLA